MKEKKRFDGSRVEKKRRQKDELQSKGGAWTTEPFPPLLPTDSKNIDNSTDEDEDKNDSGSYSCMTTLLRRIEGQRRSTTMTTLRERRVGDYNDASSGDEPPSDRVLHSKDEQGVAVSTVGLDCDVSPDKKRRVAMDDDSDDSFRRTIDSVEVAAVSAILASSATVAEDPYDVHFLGKWPKCIENSGLSSSRLQSTNGSIIPASALPRFDPSSSSLFEIFLSGRLQSAWEKCVRDCRGLKFTDAWMEFASGLYRYNRGVLKRNWEANAFSGLRESYHTNMVLNKGSGGENVEDGCTIVGCDKKRMMTSLQMTIYPAISRYADVLITSETHEVRKSEIY